MFRSIITRVSFVFIVFAALVSFAPTLSASAAASVTRSANTSIAIYSPCVDETITLTGTITVVTVSKGGYTQGNIVYSMTGESADGTSYVLNYVQNSSINAGPGLVQTQLVQYQLVSKGPGPNLQVRLQFHWTWDANLNLTAFVNTGEVVC